VGAGWFLDREEEMGMKRADQRSQSIARQLTRSYLLSSVLPVLVLTLVALGSLLLLGFQAGALIRESLQALNTQAGGSSRVDLQACKLGTGRRFTTS
jgi:hypothetical protein